MRIIITLNISFFFIHKNQKEDEKEDGHLPSYFYAEKERRGGQTSDSAVCEVPMTIGRVVCSQQNEIKNPEMGLHFNGIKPPRHFVPPLLSLRAGGEMPGVLQYAPT